MTTGGSEEDREQWWSGIAALSRRFDDEYEASARQNDIARIISLDTESHYSLASAAAYEDAVGRAASLGFTDVVAHWPREDGIYAGKRVRPRRDSRDAVAPDSRSDAGPRR